MERQKRFWTVSIFRASDFVVHPDSQNAHLNPAAALSGREIEMSA